MRFIVAFAVALFLAFPCAKLARKTPAGFYAIAAALDLVYAFGMTTGATTGASSGFWAEFLPFMQRCTLAFALFTIVMFTGVLKDGSHIKTHLMPIRRQLSISACILALCHIAHYVNAYFIQTMQATGSIPSVNLGVSFCISGILLILFAALLTTSFTFVRRRMRSKTWKRVQRFSYAFYGLTYVHLAIILLPPALSGKDEALVSMVVYTAVFITYAILRLRRGAADRKHPSSVGISIPTIPEYECVLRT